MEVIDLTQYIDEKSGETFGLTMLDFASFDQADGGIVVPANTLLFRGNVDFTEEAARTKNYWFSTIDVAIQYAMSVNGCICVYRTTRNISLIDIRSARDSVNDIDPVAASSDLKSADRKKYLEEYDATCIALGVNQEVQRRAIVQAKLLSLYPDNDTVKHITAMRPNLPEHCRLSIRTIDLKMLRFINTRLCKLNPEYVDFAGYIAPILETTSSCRPGTESFLHEIALFRAEKDVELIHTVHVKDIDPTSGLRLKTNCCVRVNDLVVPPTTTSEVYSKEINLVKYVDPSNGKVRIMQGAGKGAGKGARIYQIPPVRKPTRKFVAQVEALIARDAATRPS